MLQKALLLMDVFILVSIIFRGQNTGSSYCCIICQIKEIPEKKVEQKKGEKKFIFKEMASQLKSLLIGVKLYHK